MVTSLKNKTNLWLNYLQSRRYHLARCAKSSFSFSSLNRRGKVGKFAALETRRGPEHQACATDETKVWLSLSAKQRRNPCSGPHLCTRIWLRAMFSSLKKSYCRVANHYERKFETYIRQYTLFTISAIFARAKGLMGKKAMSRCSSGGKQMIHAASAKNRGGVCLL